MAQNFWVSMAKISNGTLSVRAHNNSEIRLQCTDVDIFRLVQKSLGEQKVNFYIHSFQEEKTLKVVVKGLLPGISEQEFGDELKSLGYDVLHMRQFGNASCKFPIHMVTLASNPVS